MSPRRATSGVETLRLRLDSTVERLRASLFFVPMIGVASGAAFGFIGVFVDSRLDSHSARLPLGFTSTVESARVLLSTIAGATITFAGIAFSISLLIIQLASSQYSPRIVHTLFRDPFNKRIMGLVVGTFTYCLIVLRSVRSPLDQGGAPVIPNLSVAVAIVLGLVTILGIVAFINHSAHAMDVSEILERVRTEATVQVSRAWVLAEPGSTSDSSVGARRAPNEIIRFDRTGWVRELDADALLRCVPEGGTIHVDAYPGRYAIEGTTLCTISPPPDDPHEVARRICAAVDIGSTRTMQQDISFALRQLADVALKALSPAVNDPTTAQDAIFHSAAVLTELLRRDPPSPRRIGEHGERLVLAQQPTHDELVRLAFDETRRAAAGQPAVCIYLLEAIVLVYETLKSYGLSDRGGELINQARLIAEGNEAAGLLPADLQLVRNTYAKRFPT